MSRSGYSDDYGDGDPLAMGRWRQAVQRALDGRRGQAFLRDLLETLDSMPDKRIYSGSFATTNGEFCTLGAHAARKGVKVDDLGDAEDGCEPEEVGQRFGIARAMAAEIMYLNDEYIVDEWEWEERVLCGPVRPYYPEHGRHTYNVRVHNDHHAEKRWGLMRQWVADSLKSFPSGRDQ
jgi:hypothetical protein